MTARTKENAPSSKKGLAEIGSAIGAFLFFTDAYGDILPYAFRNVNPIVTNLFLSAIYALAIYACVYMLRVPRSKGQGEPGRSSDVIFLPLIVVLSVCILAHLMKIVL